MGAKYLPTVKDQKATLRFQQKEAERIKAKQTAAKAPPKPAAKA